MNRQSIEGWALVATVAAAAGLTWMLTWPEWTQGTAMAVEVSELERKIVDLAGAQDTLDAATERLRIAGARQVSECRQVPPTADVAGLMQALSLKVDGHRVHDQTFTVADAPSPLSEHYEALPLQLEVVGGSMAFGMCLNRRSHCLGWFVCRVWTFRPPRGEMMPLVRSRYAAYWRSMWCTRHVELEERTDGTPYVGSSADRSAADG